MPQRSRTMPGMKSRSSILNMDMHLSTTTLVQNEEPVPLLPTPPASPPLPQLPQSQSTFSKAAKWFTVGRSSTIHVSEGANEKMKEKDRLRAQVEELQAKVKSLEPQVGELQDYLALERQKSASLAKRNKVLENETGLMKDALEKVALENASLSCDLRDVLKAQLSIEGKALISSFEQNQQIEEMALTISTLGVALKRTQEENERLTRQNLTLTETISRLEDEWSSLDEQLSEKEQVLKQALKANEAHLQRARMSNATLKSALESAEAQNRSFQYTNAALEDSNRSLSKECASMRRRLQEKEEEVKQKEKDYSTQLRNLKNRVQGLKTEVQFLNQKSTADREARAEADRNVADLAEKYELCSRLLKESDLHVENLKASLEEANTREVALKDNLGNLEDKIDFVWAEMKKEANRSHNVDSEKRHLEQVMAGKESLWSQKEQQYKDMIENVKSEQRRKVTELQSDLARFRSSASSIEKAVREHRDHNDILKPHVDALRRMIWPPTTPARLALEDWYRRAA